jgi:DNA-binding response OmpR family regulator
VSITVTEVELLHWPRDAERRDELHRRKLPRLLLVAAGVRPPVLDLDEDWVRLPADERELADRLQRLAALYARRVRRPEISDDVVLRCGGCTAILSDSEAALLAPLIERFGRLVTRDELRSAVWPDGSGTRHGLEALVSRLRARIQPAGLVLHPIRGRGLILDNADVESPA